MIVTGTAKFLVGVIHLAVDHSQHGAGVVYCAILLESNDGDDGKWWDANDDTWQTFGNVVAWPTAAHKDTAGMWGYELPAVATTGKAGAHIHYNLTDHITEASATTVCHGGEHEVINATPVGSRQITIHVQDGVAAPIGGVHVSVYDATNVTFLTRGDTDTNGNLLVALDDATYKLRMAKGLFGFTVPESMVVTADATKTFIGTAFTAPTPSAPDKCVLFGTIRDSGAQPMAGVQVDVYATTEQFVGDITLGNRLGTTMTDAVGYFQIELGKGTEVRFKVVDAGIDWTKTVPSTANKNIKDWA